MQSTRQAISWKEKQNDGKREDPTIVLYLAHLVLLLTAGRERRGECVSRRTVDTAMIG